MSVAFVERWPVNVWSFSRDNKNIVVSCISVLTELHKVLI